MTPAFGKGEGKGNWEKGMGNGEARDWREEKWRGREGNVGREALLQTKIYQCTAACSLCCVSCQLLNVITQ